MELCPVQALIKYVGLRGEVAGPLFCHVDHTPLIKFQFEAVIVWALESWDCQGLFLEAIPFGLEWCPLELLWVMGIWLYRGLAAKDTQLSSHMPSCCHTCFSLVLGSMFNGNGSGAAF